MHSFVELLRIDAAFALIGSFVTCFLIIHTVRWHGKLSIDSSVGLQKFHTAPTPRIGGIGIAVGVLLGFAFSSHEIAATEKRAILSTIILAGIPAFIFGLLEDLTKRVSVTARLLATMASGLLGWGITGVSLVNTQIIGLDWLLGFTFISVIFTAFAVGGIANAVNIIDGFNGLASGAVIIMLTAFGLISRSVNDIPLAYTCLVLACSMLGFFAINWPSGKIFLGDGGAYFIGFCVAWVAILLPTRNPSVSPWASFLICSYPIFEVVFSFFRKIRREGHHPGQPDRVHLHMLIHRRIARKLFKFQSSSIKNGFTSPFIWAYVALSATSSVLVYKNIWGCIASVFVLSLIYIFVYRRMTKFRWL